jgi:hypothetical protein
VAVDANDELVHAKRWKRKAWKVRGERYVLVVADRDARWPTYIER